MNASFHDVLNLVDLLTETLGADGDVDWAYVESVAMRLALIARDKKKEASK